MTNNVILYSTEGCHLCDLAKAIIEEVAPHLTANIDCQVVDIAFDDALFSRYGTVIPVLKRTDSDAELNWPFDHNDVVEFML